jgi:hypothetical protein
MTTLGVREPVAQLAAEPDQRHGRQRGEHGDGHLVAAVFRPVARDGRRGSIGVRHPAALDHPHDDEQRREHEAAEDPDPRASA